jgi:amino acid adenylation domain-containing protein
MSSPTVLSSAQQRLWLLEQLVPERATYLMTRAFELAGPVDAGALEQALRLVAERHATLRSRIMLRDGEPMAVHEPADTVRLEKIHLEDKAAGMALLRASASRPCDLTVGPMLRATLICLSDNHHLFQYVVHHIAFDGSSRVIFEREVSAAYAALTGGHQPSLPPLAMQYSDYAVRERASAADGELASQEEYWVTRLRGAATMNWPAGRDHLAEPSAVAAQHQVTVGRDVCTRLLDLAAAEHTSLFVVALAAYQFLLGQMARTDDVVVGIPVAGRLYPELDELIGFFTNTAAARADLSGGPSLRQLVRQVRQSVLDALDHQEVPFERVVEALGADRDRRRNPLFQHWFGTDAEPSGRGLELPAVSCTTITQPAASVRFDTELEIGLSDGELGVELTYAADLFDAVTMRRFAERYRTLLAEASNRPDTRLSSLCLLVQDEIRELMSQAAGPRPSAPVPPMSLAQGFARQVARSPDAVAVADFSVELTYRDLDAAASRMAGRLRAAGVAEGDIVALYLPRCADMIVAMLAIVRVNAAYLPMGLEVPAERLGYMLSDSGATALLTRQALRARIPVTAALSAVLATDDETGAWASMGASMEGSTPASQWPGDRLLYVIYTSGSTGRPKGVAVSHQQLGGLVRWHHDTYSPQAGDRIAQLASLSFDAAGWEIWPALLAGARLQICPEELSGDPAAVTKWLAEQAIDVTFAPTPMAEQLIREPLARRTRLRRLLFGGDVFRPREDDDPGIPVINHYGPTENACVSTATGPLQSPWADNSIGKPISGVRVYLVDRDLRLVPNGVIGELCLGGAGVAWGYWRRPRLTAERFVPDPFAGEPGGRLYRTGDLAWWRPDGTLHYAGRLDDQLEVNGHRIEPAEIEVALLAHPAVRAVTVIAKQAPSGGQVLAAYVVPEGAMPPADRLRAHLASTLPRYMIPRVFVALAELPTTPTGKVDRGRLPEPEKPLAGSSAPATAAERLMGGLWTELLGIPAVGADDDFFALGGNSMNAARLLNRIRATFGIDFSLRDIFDHSSLAELSSAVTDQVRAEVEAMSPEQITVALAEAGDRG